MSDYIKTNQELWEHKTPIHLESEFYELAAFKQGKNSLKSIEMEAMGNVSDKKILHLQCHFGQDTLSWARMGAIVTGVDFSHNAIAAANDLSKELNVPATFVQSDVLKLKDNLQGEFDIIFTSYGVVGWLDDLNKWASVIDHFLKPGGTFYIAEFHPFIHMHDFQTQKIVHPYFNPGEPLIEVEEGTYADPNAKIALKEYFWFHSLSEIMTELLNAGLTIKEFKEFDYSPYNCFPDMTERKPGEFIFGKYPSAIPHVFSIKATK